ncbi:quinone-dependent dihydroorotate dehydrogenase [Tanticharoenia sakaeratensis]|uniref:Dihydroorotate dehydrogenase (quinone) n=1 Tax=Tanticharoenia sakaeratensis NBRC 103193 TaxID=1231623 RepID=A0A0D6MGF3_9PROT|nr:quinone-dependent dihydroorotate dehydrogenase [Tanticharoenia sakaeratensis]GAN52719.1 dihydroorotate dehydrogenase 2 [Tanticharoenia sakaeratensis NBRC 103193]GBQ24302.1 dihydroorotate dehydrogenase 2 [Tanticharoenia sakaeratensis NBRC 103193]
MTLLNRLAPFALHRLPPETAHEAAIAALLLGLGGRAPRDVPALSVRAMGLRFPNPIGLAAGFDKDARAIRPLGQLGFGAIEAGTVTPRPQPGQAKPRLFRLPEDGALINRMGFNGCGIDRFCRRLARLYRPMPGGRVRGAGVPLGANLGINKEGADPLGDYAALVARVGPYVDYVTINLSSPNTPGLRDLQSADLLGQILAAIAERNPERPPLLIKLAPDLPDDALQPIIEAAVSGGADGLILTNTTIARPADLRSPHAAESGGLSGRPLHDRSRDMLRRAAALNAGRLALISCGGIESGADILERIRMGCDLVQIYTRFIYEGAAMLPRLKQELLVEMRAGGFETLADAKGTVAISP